MADEPGSAEYTEAIAEAGISEDQFNNSPNWEKKRLGEMTKVNVAAKAAANEAARRAAKAEGEAEALRAELAKRQEVQNTPAPRGGR